MTEIRFDNGNTVTIRDGCVQAPTPELTAILDLLAATLPGYGSIPFILDEDFNIAQGLIRIVGVGKIVRRDKMPPFTAIHNPIQKILTSLAVLKCSAPTPSSSVSVKQQPQTEGGSHEN